MISENFDNPASAVDIFVKDMSLVLDAARKNKFPAHAVAKSNPILQRLRSWKSQSWVCRS